MDEPDARIDRVTIAAASTRTPNPFSGLSRPADPTIRSEACGNIASSRPRSAGSGLIEPLGPDGVADDDHAVGSNAGAADLDGLPLRDTDHPVHPPQADPIERLVNPHLPGLRGPAMGNAITGMPARRAASRPTTSAL